jgi:hypothetical protein
MSSLLLRAYPRPPHLFPFIPISLLPLHFVIPIHHPHIRLTLTSPRLPLTTALSQTRSHPGSLEMAHSPTPSAEPCSLAFETTFGHLAADGSTLAHPLRVSVKLYPPGYKPRILPNICPFALLRQP